MKAVITLLLKNRIYLTFLLAFIFNTLEAQIIYTDIIPDSVVNTNGGVYHLDLNNDGLVDFNFNLKLSTTSNTHCTGTKSNTTINVSPADSSLDAVAYTFDTFDSLYYLEPILADSIISSNSSLWVSDSNQLMVYYHWTCKIVKGTHYAWTSSNTGDWGLGSNKFMGLRIIVGVDTLYGWVRFSISSGSITVSDYAYSNASGAVIFAGQTASEFLNIAYINGSPFCPGNNFDIVYSAFGNFDTSNVFTAQLSDSSGSFAAPVVLGSIHTNHSDTINAAIPPLSSYGLQYRIRITSSNPPGIMALNGNDLIVDSNLLSTQIYTSDTTNFCPGFYALLYAQWGDTYSYQWTRNGVNLPIDAYYPSEYQADSAGIYRCLITNACGSVLSDSIVITNTPSPAVSITTAGSLWVCPGQHVNFNSYPATGYYYEWYRNGVSISGANQPLYTAYQAGRYWVHISDSAGCENSSNQDTVTMSNPLATIIAGGPTTICAGDSVILTQTSAVDSSFTFQWLKDSVNVPGATVLSFTAFQTGSYKVIVTNPSGNCSSTSANIDVSVGCSGVENYGSMDAQIMLNPNPASHFLYVEGRIGKSAKVQILNQVGQIMFSRINNLSRMAIDISKFPQGVYLVQWVEPGFNETKRFSVVR
jgi:hypothetical protein